MGEFLDRRRAESDGRLAELKQKLAGEESRCDGKACVYATGSFARGEANRHSDLDLFIVGLCEPKDGENSGKQIRALKGLEEILLKATLIMTVRDSNIPEFSGDGQYLTHHMDKDLISKLGQPEDDAFNTFTARLLLLLESRPLIGESVYDRVIPEVLEAYWRDYKGHESEFAPVFLANDILRLWRTFCVNYEARSEKDPPLKNAKRKLKNYKLKHSRLLTCYSAVLYLLAVHTAKLTVGIGEAAEMVALAPTQRLEWLLREPRFKHVRSGVERLIEQYEMFLSTTDCGEEQLVGYFMDEAKGKQLTQSAGDFGGTLFEVFTNLNGNSRFYRMLIV